MVLSTRRGSAALLCPGLSGPHGLGPRARTQAFLGSAPPRHSPAASTAAPPPAAALRSAAGGDPLLDTARGPAPGAGSPGQRAAAGRRLTRQAVAAALRALRNARRGPGARRRSAALGGARARRRRLRSFCPRFCRRRGPAPRSAAFAVAALPLPLPLPPRRALRRPPSRERARLTRRRGRTWCRGGAGDAAVLSTSRARCGQRRGREPEASLLAAPQARTGTRAAAPPPGPPPPAQLAARSAPPRQQQPGRVRV